MELGGGEGHGVRGIPKDPAVGLPRCIVDDNRHYLKVDLTQNTVGCNRNLSPSPKLFSLGDL